MTQRPFETEAEMCQAFIDTVPKTWTVYPETGGFDMLLVHAQGFQIGMEAKLNLNSKVIAQAADTGARRGLRAGPDARAVLVPRVHNRDLAKLCDVLSLTVVRIEPSRFGMNVWPQLPKPEKATDAKGNLDVCSKMLGVWQDREWYDLCPIEQVKLPEYVPDVLAGVPHPVILGRWKIQAMKVCVWITHKGGITRAHFRALGIDPGRWMDGNWLEKGRVRGEWVAGPGFPQRQFREQHPVVWEQVNKDFAAWSEASGLNDLPGLAGGFQRGALYE